MDPTAMVESPAQHMRALEEANRVRLARSDLKRRIGRGDITVAEVIRSSPWEARTMTIAELLRSQHRWGGARCRRFLNSTQIQETKKVGSMTPRQREILARCLSEPGRGSEQLWPAWAA
jgi:hypothetical protein